MSLAHQPDHEPERPGRPALRIVGDEQPPSNDPVALHPHLATSAEDRPVRGIVVGVGLSLAGFWIPAAAFLYAWLIR